MMEAVPLTPEDSANAQNFEMVVGAPRSMVCALRHEEFRQGEREVLYGVRLSITHIDKCWHIERARIYMQKL